VIEKEEKRRDRVWERGRERESEGSKYLKKERGRIEKGE